MEFAFNTPKQVLTADYLVKLEKFLNKNKIVPCTLDKKTKPIAVKSEKLLSSLIGKPARKWKIGDSVYWYLCTEETMKNLLSKINIPKNVVVIKDERIPINENS